MKYTLFDGLGCLFDMSEMLQGLEVGVVYPRVVLIGEEDSGKSCLLESLAGLHDREVRFVSKAYLGKRGCVKTCAHLEDAVSGVPIILVPYDLETVKQFIEPANSVIVLMIRAEKNPPRRLFELVAQVDPDCQRTLGVLSCFDYMTRNTCNNILLYNELQVPFKLVGIANKKSFEYREDLFKKYPREFAGLEAVISNIVSMASRLFICSGGKPELKRMRSGS